MLLFVRRAYVQLLFANLKLLSMSIIDFYFMIDISFSNIKQYIASYSRALSSTNVTSLSTKIFRGNGYGCGETTLIVRFSLSTFVIHTNPAIFDANTSAIFSAVDTPNRWCTSWLFIGTETTFVRCSSRFIPNGRHESGTSSVPIFTIDISSKLRSNMCGLYDWWRVP